MPVGAITKAETPSDMGRGVACRAVPVTRFRFSEKLLLVLSSCSHDVLSECSSHWRMVDGSLGMSRRTLDRQLINVHDGGSLRVEPRWTCEALLMLGQRQASALR